MPVVEQIIGTATEGDDTYDVWGREALPKVGEVAPDIDLISANADGSLNEFKLSDFRGKKTVTLVWMNATFSGTCTEEICELDQLRQALLSDEDVEVITTSTDLPWASLAWKIANQVNHTVAWASLESGIDYGRGIKKPVPFFQRGVDVIDKDGILRFSVSYDKQEETPDLIKPISLARGLSAKFQ